MSWDDLSMREKAAMMRVAVKNKIFEIDKIKEAYDSQGKQVSNSEVINPNQYTPSVNLNVNPALDYVGNALESISGYEYEGNPLNKLGIDMSFDLGTTGSSMYPNGIRFVKKFDDGGPKKRYISYYELANNPDKYGYHLDADKKNGKDVYYNAANQQWFYADKAKDKNNLSEITEDYLDMPENKQAEFKRENEFNLNQPATMSYISSQIDGMKTPAEIQAMQNAHKEQAKEMIEWFPFVGDAIDGYDMAKQVYTDIKDGDYLGASGKTAAGLALLFAPKWLQELYEGSKDAYKAYRKTQKAKNLIKQGTGNKGQTFKEAMANAEEYVDLYKKHIDRDGPVDGNYLLEELREAEKIAQKYPKYNAIRSKNNDYSLFSYGKLDVNLHDLQEQESLINNAVESVGPRLKNIYDNLDNIDNTGLLKRIYDDAESPELQKYLRDISISNNVDNIPLDDIVKTALQKNYTTWRRMTPKKLTLTADDFLTFRSNSSPGLQKSHAFVDPQKYKFINTGGLEVAGSQYGLHAARYTPKLDQFDLSGTPADWWANRNSFWNSFNKEGITATTGMHFGSHKNVPVKNFNTTGLLDINVPKYMLPAQSGHKVFIGETGTSMKNFFDVDLFMDYKDGYLYNTKERVRDLDPLNQFFIDPDTELDFKYGGKINRF